MATKTIEQVLQTADLGSAERDFIVKSLKAAVSYCKQQYADSLIDWLPSADEIGLADDDKFDLLLAFVDKM